MSAGLFRFCDEAMTIQQIKADRYTPLLMLLSLFFSACGRPQESPDHPRLTSTVVLKDLKFHSTALNREMQYRVILPTQIEIGRKLPVVYLLHGGGGGFRDWSNYTDVARFAERGLILVMPDGDDSYYTNSVDRPEDRYEDYLVEDLVRDVERQFPAAATGRANRAIVGISMGGFGAVKLAFKDSDLFGFAAGMSSAVDVPSRPFAITRWRQWRYHRSIFGPWGGKAQRDNDPMLLARVADPAKTPYLLLICGDKEGLLPANRLLAGILEKRHFPHEFHVVPGGHDWTQWNASLPKLFSSLQEHFQTNASH